MPTNQNPCFLTAGRSCQLQACVCENIQAPRTDGLGTLPSPLLEERQGWQVLTEEVVVQITEKSPCKTCQKRLTSAEETL